MNLAIRRSALLTLVSACVFGISWLVLLAISRFFLRQTVPLSLGTVLQASAGSFCFAYSIAHLRSRVESTPLAHAFEAIGIAAFGIGLWVTAGHYLVPSAVPLRTFALPSQISMVLGGVFLLAARLLRRPQASKAYLYFVVAGTSCIGALLIVLLIEVWYR